MNGFAPPVLKIPAAVLASPIRAYDFIRRAPRELQNRIENLQMRMRTVKRSNQRLNDADGSIQRARIAPVFKEVRFGDVPMRLERSLVEMQARADRRFDLFEPGSKREIRRRIKYRIAAENQQHIHFAGVHVLAKLLQRCDLIDGLRLNRIGINHRLPDVAERRVDGMTKRMYAWALLDTRNHHAGAFVRSQIGCDRRSPRRVCARWSSAADRC